LGGGEFAKGVLWWRRGGLEAGNPSLPGRGEEEEENKGGREAPARIKEKNRFGTGWRRLTPGQ